MFCRNKRKMCSGCLFGLGLGILLAIYLPLRAWLFIIGATLIIVGLGYLFGR